MYITAMVDIVMKVGGGLLAHRDCFDAVLATIGAAGGGRRLLVVPGGGPFADAVRSVDRRLRLSAEAAHWMAVLAMDQYGHLIADRLAGGVLVSDRTAIGAALEARQVPVLAPFRWMRDVDPLPHTWDVTSDSIAAWVAGEVGARKLVLVKPPGAAGGSSEARDLVDAYFSRAMPAAVTHVVVGADHTNALRRALQESN
jgi:5-(aminomethyl)-3-furanmethanol phosphate kinase